MAILQEMNPYVVRAYLEDELAQNMENVQVKISKSVYVTTLDINGTKVRFHSNSKGKPGNTDVQGINEIEIQRLLVNAEDRLAISRYKRKKVFVVFAHDRGGVYAENVAKAVKAVGLEPIMLKDQPNNSRSVLEKLQKHFEECQYTIVIATQDEKVQADEAIYRTRPNVMLELGIVLGRAWSTKTDANILIFNEGDVIKGVSDISGLAWESVENIQDDSTFHEILYKEFKAAGLYNI